MATLSVPLTFEQHSPYIRGNITYLWYDPDAVSGVAGGNASANGISSITTNLSAATTVVSFDSNASAVVDIEGATSGLEFTVPNDYNSPITIEVTANIEVGQVSSATTLLTKTLRHSFNGISDTVFTASPADPSFSESDVLSLNRKSLGTFSINDVDANAEYTATITYDKTIGSIDYANTDILTENSANDQVITSNVTLFNNTISNLDYLPLTVANGGDLESIQAQDVTIVVTSNVDSRIPNNSSTISVGVSTETEFSGIENFTYVENTVNSNVLPNLFISDTADANVSTVEIYSVVVDPAQSLGNLDLNYTTNVEFYAGTGADSNISANAVIVQGPVGDVNNALANGFAFYPDIEQTTNTTFTVDLYRAPSGTAANLDINDNYGTFTKLFDSNAFTITNSATVDTFTISSNSVTMTEADANVSLPSTTTTADSRDTTNIDLTIGVTTTVPIGNDAGEFGNITSATGGTWSSSTGEFTYTGTQSQIDAVTANLVYNPGQDTIADSTLTYQIQVQGESPIYQESANISITPVQETGNITIGNAIVYDSDNVITSTPYEFNFSISDPDAANVDSNITVNVTLSSNIGTISSTVGTYDANTLTWTYTDTLSNINTVTANMDLNLHSNASTNANITIEYIDNQDLSGNVSASSNLTVRTLDYDPVFMSSNTYVETDVYIYTSNNQIEVYYDFDLLGSGNWGKKDTYDISNIANVTVTTTTSPYNLHPFGGNVYANYQSNSVPSLNINHNHTLPGDPTNTTQHIRGTDPELRGSYWYLIPKFVFQDEFPVAEANVQYQTLGGTYQDVIGPWVGTDNDCSYTSTRYKLETSSLYGNEISVHDISDRECFYHFGDRTTPGNLVYGQFTTARNDPINIQKETTGLSSSVLHVSNTNILVAEDKDLQLSGDDITGDIVLAYNTIYLDGSRSNRTGRIKLYNSTSSTPIKTITLTAGDVVVNQQTITFVSTTTSGSGSPYNPNWGDMRRFGNKHWMHNKHFALLDNQGKLVIYKKN